MPERVPARAVLALLPALLAALGGAALAVCAAVLSAWWWGLVLGVLAAAATAAALPPGWRARVPFCLGWAVVVLRLAVERPEGDYVVGANMHGYLLLALTLALVVGSLVSGSPRRPRA